MEQLSTKQFKIISARTSKACGAYPDSTIGSTTTEHAQTTERGHGLLGAEKQASPYHSDLRAARQGQCVCGTQAPRVLLSRAEGWLLVLDARADRDEV